MEGIEQRSADRRFGQSLTIMTVSAVHLRAAMVRAVGHVDNQPESLLTVALQIGYRTVVRRAPDPPFMHLATGTARQYLPLLSIQPCSCLGHLPVVVTDIRDHLQTPVEVDPTLIGGRLCGAEKVHPTLQSMIALPHGTFGLVELPLLSVVVQCSQQDDQMLAERFAQVMLHRAKTVGIG
ncbi:MAG TPA: hypothetical protein VGE27_08165, partial [Gemmatimonas sp.]|uniref:hypothetical protein n=1 Tax=Gemmatimonas sp. TaxID=1962908 RepID=UPI002EDAE512